MNFGQLYALVQIDGGKPCFQCELENERKMKKAGASGGAKKIDRLNNVSDWCVCVCVYKNNVYMCVCLCVTYYSNALL